MKKDEFSFELIAQDDNARLGRISTPKGKIDTPVFMPVGTQGTVKGVYTDDILETGTQIILGNTYHLLLRPGIEILDEAMKNTMPTLQGKPRRVGGATYQVPVEITPNRRVALAHRWVVEAARSNKGQSIEDSLYTEFMNAVNNTGNAIKKKEDSHRMAEANRAFAHYRW